MATITTEYARRRNAHRRPMGRRCAAIPVAAVMALSMMTSAQAQQWRFTPTLSLTETLTDNVNLAPRGAEKGDLVTQVSPGFTLYANTPRLKAALTYSLQATLHAASDNASDLTNQLNGTLSATLVRDLFYVDATAAIGQQNTSLFGAQSASNINTNANRADVRSYSLSPYVVNRIGNVATSQVRYTHTGTSAGSGLLSSSNSDALRWNLASGPRYTRANWGVNLSTQHTHYGDVQDVTQSSASVNAGYLVLPTLRLIATGGFEKNNYVTTGDEPKGAFYNAGFTWTPSSRTSVTATAGHRYFGRTYSLAASQRARNVVVSVNYTDDVTSSQAELARGGLISTASQLNLLYSPQITDPVARQSFVDALIRQFGLPPSLAVANTSFTNRYFEQKSLQASVSLSGARSTVVGTLFDTRRIPVQGQQSAQLATLGLDDNTKQLGATALWNLRLSPRSSAFTNLSHTRSTSLATDQRSNYTVARVGMTTAFQRKLNGTLELRHSQQSSNFQGGDIRENAITASLLAQF